MTCGAVRVGIIGVGNRAPSSVQGIIRYKDTTANEAVPGLMNVEAGGHHAGDVAVPSARAVSAAKVSRFVAGEA